PRLGERNGEIPLVDFSRCEPATGGTPFPAIARALFATGDRGTVGLERAASCDDELALRHFRDTFSLQGGRCSRTDGIIVRASAGAGHEPLRRSERMNPFFCAARRKSRADAGTRRHAATYGGD